MTLAILVKRLTVAALLPTAIATPVTASVASPATVSGQPGDLRAFLAKRSKIAETLTAPIAICVAHHDTTNPAFHGCIDWHSSAHGTWALTAYTMMSGDRRYVPLINSILQPVALAQERRHLNDDSSFEMPYGRAWFLRLALDYQRGFQSALLQPFADDVAASIVAHYRTVEPDPRSIAYDSSTWALINLYDYSAMRGDRSTLDFVTRAVRKYYMADDPCPIERLEVETREFMAVCTNWAWLVQRVLPRTEFQTWLARFLPSSIPINPIISADSVHQAGLNFSRTWGLWSLYYQTSDKRFLDAYLANFTATYDKPEIWKLGAYNKYAHWIAQFGMLGLMVSFYDIPHPEDR